MISCPGQQISLPDTGRSTNTCRKSYPDAKKALLPEAGELSSVSAEPPALQRRPLLLRQQRVQRLQKGVGGHALRQTQFPAQRLPPGGGVGADQSLFQQIRLGKPQGAAGASSPSHVAPQRRRASSSTAGGIPSTPSLPSLPPLRLRRSLPYTSGT